MCIIDCFKQLTLFDLAFFTVINPCLLVTIYRELDYNVIQLFRIVNWRLSRNTDCLILLSYLIVGSLIATLIYSKLDTSEEEKPVVRKMIIGGVRVHVVKPSKRRR